MTAKDVLFSQFGWWIQLFVTLTILGLGVYTFIKLYVVKSKLVSKTNIDAIIVLGGFNIILGICLQIIGMVMALEAIIQAADVSPVMIMGGFKISFYTTIYGMFTFLVSALIWYVNKIKWEQNQMA